MAARSNLVAERSLQAEYILKSLLNFARVLIKEDTTEESSVKDAWGKFVGGQNVDPAILGLNVPGLHIELEIQSEDSKVPVPALVTRGVKVEPDLKWRYVLECLFKDLGFNDDTEEVWRRTPYQGRFFNAQQLVSNLVDYLDPDSESHDVQGFEKGSEGELKEKEQEVFKNGDIVELDELSNIPGFTPARLRRVLPYLTTHGAKTVVNINLASRRVLKCLHPSMDDGAIDKMVAFRESEGGPFTKENLASEMNKIVDDATWNGTGSQSGLSMLAYVGPRQGETPHFLVLAKVDYGAATYFMRAFVYRWNAGDLPVISSVEIF